MKEIHLLVQSWKKIDNEPEDSIFGVLKDFVRKLTDYFFTILEEPIVLRNQKLFTVIKQYSKPTRSYGPMHINFYDYPPYNDAISDTLRQK